MLRRKILIFPRVLIEGTTDGAHSTAQKVWVRVGTLENGDEEVQG